MNIKKNELDTKNTLSASGKRLWVYYLLTVFFLCLLLIPPINSFILKNKICNEMASYNTQAIDRSSGITTLGALFMSYLYNHLLSLAGNISQVVIDIALATLVFFSLYKKSCSKKEIESLDQ